MNRSTALSLARLAGYHGDAAAFTRLLIESGVNQESMKQAWRSGATAKRNGVRCDCPDCMESAAAEKEAA